MNPEIFREYDIRGIAGEDITGEDVVLIGKAVGSFLISRGHKKLSVGRDCRLTSESYSERVIEGLLSTGCDVIDIGVCPTPVFYFSIQHLVTQGGVMVTASHNPPEYNGFKLCIDLDSIHGADIQVIREMIEKRQFAEGRGKRIVQDVIPAYHDFVVSNIRIGRVMKVGIDAGNGTGGVVAVPIIRKLKCEVHELYCDMDGTFPNHEADPTVAKNMKDLIALVRDKGLDLGIGYDGDSDRIGVVDEKGNLVYGDQLMIIFSREILSRKPGAAFISEVKCSKTMYDDIAKNGGKPIMWKTGHSLIKKKMKEEKAELAGEMSGHLFFADRYFGYDDAIYASCRLLEILSNSGKTISELLSDVPRTFNTPEIRVDCPDRIKFQVVKEVTRIFREQYDVIDIDGVRVLFHDGWGLVRASNTQPALVLRFESMTQERLDEIRSLVEKTLEDVKRKF
ncbi:MAG: phosphomannomutase/phosphoglucomutase [Desulfobacteraceae bacterium]|nr:MAG: phosphomannomutase/phosphoglucomutase [Desulfobacteraceae bacterium]